jgi:hypothetical protein
MINKIMKIKSAYGIGVLIIFLAFLPYSASAQTDATTTTPDSSTDTTIIDTRTDTTVAVSTSSPQEATTTQDAIDAPDLEGTANPQEGSSTDDLDTIIVPSATSTATSTPDTGNIVIVPASSTSTPTVQIPVADDSVVGDVTATSTADNVAQLPANVLTPTKEYTFALSGESIATQQTPDWNQGDASSTPDADATVSATPSLDTTGANTLTVSGQCSDPYFVVLLYKNEEDYNENPSSYIFNKAYPCENGEYSYAISQLPFNLKSGRFYLLVAGQGATGSWKPITALIPVGITVTTVFPTASSTSDGSADTTN